jgi:hypothetical protein
MTYHGALQRRLKPFLKIKLPVIIEIMVRTIFFKIGSRMDFPAPPLRSGSRAPGTFVDNSGYGLSTRRGEKPVDNGEPVRD